MIGVECLAVAIFFEARDQPLSGQFAVAEVVMNRVVDQRWPSTICDVVFQHRQFSFTHDGKSDRIDAYMDNIEDWKAAVTAREIAYQVYSDGYTEMTSTHYHALSVSPSWAKHYTYDGRVGDHVFYTAPVGK